MPERKPRTIDVRVRKCPNCGRLSDGRYTGGLFRQRIGQLESELAALRKADKELSS